MVEHLRCGSPSALDKRPYVALWWWLSVVAAGFADRVTASLVRNDDAAGEEALSPLARANLSDAVASALGAGIPAPGMH